MADKIKAIKIKQINGTYSEEIPISVNVQNVEWDENNHTLLDALGSVDISSSGKGNLQHQIDELDGDKISTNQFNSRLNDFLREQISADTTDWLDDNVNPVGSAVIVDKTLTIDGAAADAKAVGDELTAVKADLDTLADITPIPNNSDLNNYAETGLYSIEVSTYTILNYPPVNVSGSYLEVRKLTNGYIGQKLTIPGNGKVFTRSRYSNGNWNPWRQIALQADLDNISSNKIDIQQSLSDSGKALVIGSDGRVRPETVMSGDGLTDEVKEALLACFENVAWIGQDGQDYYDDLYAALYNGPQKQVVSISAEYSQPRVFDVGESISLIKPNLIVTATYDDETEKVVSNYALSGSLSEDGRNLITVTFKGISETFNVLAAPAGRWVNNVLTIPNTKLIYGNIGGVAPTYVTNPDAQTRSPYVGAWIDFDEKYTYKIQATTSAAKTLNVAAFGIPQTSFDNYAQLRNLGSGVDSTWQSNGYVANSDDLFIGKNIRCLFIPIRYSDNSKMNKSLITSLTITRALKG